MEPPEEQSKVVEISTITTSMTQAASQNTTQKKNKRKRHPKPQQPIVQFSLRNPPWCYIHLQHLAPTAAPRSQLDAVTAHLHLTAALSSFLGLHGSAIPFDILRLEGRDVWIRVPADDRAALVAAVGGWVSGGGEGWRVKGWSHWDAGGGAQNGGQDLFG